MTERRILIAPAGGKSQIDYRREASETKNFTQSGRWTGGKGSDKLQAGDLFAFALDGVLWISHIEEVWKTGLKNQVRPWWNTLEYDLITVVQFGPVIMIAELKKYSSHHGYKERMGIQGRAIHRWDPTFESQCKRVSNAFVEEKTLPLPPKQSGYVYFITEEPFGGWIKIGYSKDDPSRRLGELQTGNPRKLTILDCVSCLDYKKFEAHMHRCFDAKRGVGEWFQLQPQEIKDLTDFLKSDSL